MLRGPRSDAQQTVRNVHTIQQQTETISNACRDMGPLSNMMPVPSLWTTEPHEQNPAGEARWSSDWNELKAVAAEGEDGTENLTNYTNIPRVSCLKLPSTQTVLYLSQLHPPGFPISKTLVFLLSLAAANTVLCAFAAAQ